MTGLLRCYLLGLGSAFIGFMWVTAYQWPAPQDMSSTPICECQAPADAFIVPGRKPAQDKDVVAWLDQWDALSMSPVEVENFDMRKICS